MACPYLRGYAAPRCGVREHFPVPSMVEEIYYCLGGEEEHCPHYRRALALGRPMRRGEEEEIGPAA